jgi:hypothetical protein
MGRTSLVLFAIWAAIQTEVHIPTDGTIGHVSIVDGTRTINIDNEDRVILKDGQSLSIAVDGPALENLAILPEFPVTNISLEEEDPLSREQLAGLQKLRYLR